MKKKSIVLIVVLVGATLLGLLAWRWTQKRATESVEQAHQSIAVAVDVAAIRPMKGMINYSGTLEANNEVTIVSQASGTITKMRMQVGRRCSAGDVLAVVENELQQAAVEQAEAQKLTAETNYAKAQNDLQRARALRADTIVTQSDIENMELAAQAALAQVKSAAAALKIAQKQLDDTYIKASICGTLASKKADIGMTIGPGFEMGTIVDDSKMKMTVLVSENDVVKVKSRQNVEIVVDALPLRRFAGYVRSIGAVVAANGRSYPVECELTGGDIGDLRSGMFARSSIVVAIKDSALSVAQSAVNRDPNGTASVFVLDGDTAKKVIVELGLNSNDRWEIETGLTPGQRVVTEGKERIKDGSKVRKATGQP